MEGYQNVHLTIYPPDARIHVSAPLAMTEDAVRLFLITKLPWIRQRVSQILDQNRQTPREYVSGENHYYKGQRYRLKVVYDHIPAKVEVQGNEYLVCMFAKTARWNVEPKYLKSGIVQS